MAKANTVAQVKDLSLRQIVQLIMTCGNNVAFHLEGEPGVGKSSILEMLKKVLGESKYDFVYVDCPLIDLPDFAMPYVADGVTHYAPSAMWKLKSNKPKVVMLDELSKSPTVVKPMFTRLVLERCIGEFNLPEGSIVFSTGNYASDGVGDSMQGHVNNRVGKISVAKPTQEEWIEWAILNEVNGGIISVVHQMPQLLQSYKDDPKGENEYIFNPKRNTGAFVSPRSLAKAGFILDHREEFGNDLTLEALKGIIGVSAAAEFITILDVADSLPTWEAIEKNPAKTEIPKSKAAQLLLLFGSISRVNKKNAEAYTSYFYRFEDELKMLWARQFKNKLEAVMGVKEFRETLVACHWIFS